MYPISPLVIDQDAASAEIPNSFVMTGSAKPMVMMSKNEKKKPAPTTQRIQRECGQTGIRSSRASSSAPLEEVRPGIFGSPWRDSSIESLQSEPLGGVTMATLIASVSEVSMFSDGALPCAGF